MHANNDRSRTTTFRDEGIVFSNLEPDEEEASSNTLATFANRLSKRLGIKVVTQPASEEEEDECEFDLRMMDVPDDVLATNTEPDLLEVRFAVLGRTLWQRTRHKRLFAYLLLFVLLIVLVSISAFGQTLLGLFPLSSLSPRPTPVTHFTYGSTSNVPVQATEPNFVSRKSNSEVTVVARSIPQYCPDSVMLGQGRQVGNFPVWMSGIDSGNAANTSPRTNA